MLSSVNANPMFIGRRSSDQDDGFQSRSQIEVTCLCTVNQSIKQSPSLASPPTCRRVCDCLCFPLSPLAGYVAQASTASVLWYEACTGPHMLQSMQLSRAPQLGRSRPLRPSANRVASLGQGRGMVVIPNVGAACHFQVLALFHRAQVLT